MSINPPFTVIVPARLASSRLPNKVLCDIGGLPMIIRVLQRVALSHASRIIAAVDSPILVDVITKATFTAILTGTHDSGSSRLAEAAKKLNLPDNEIIINVQGDEPFIEPDIITRIAHRLHLHNEYVCATACRPLRKNESDNPNVVKVVADKDRSARYFSRSLIPYPRNSSEQSLARAHLGIYGYRMHFLQKIPFLSKAPTEACEELEQLRFLWHGYKIALLEVQSESFGIDTPEDLALAQRYIKK